MVGKSTARRATLGKMSSRKVKVKKGYHHGDLASALVTAATQTLESDGPEAVTLRDVARRAGVSVAAPYRHFVDREALIAAVLTEGFLELARVTETARLKAADAEASVLAVGLAYLRYAAKHPVLYRVMFGHAGKKAAHPGLMAAGRQALEVLVRAVEAARADGALLGESVQLVTLAGWALVHGLSSLQADGLLVGGGDKIAGDVQATIDFRAGAGADGRQLIDFL